MPKLQKEDGSFDLLALFDMIFAFGRNIMTLIFGA